MNGFKLLWPCLLLLIGGCAPLTVQLSSQSPHATPPDASDVEAQFLALYQGAYDAFQFHDDIDEALRLLDEAIAFSRRHDFIRGEASAVYLAGGMHQIRGSRLQENGEDEQALAAYQSALAYYQDALVVGRTVMSPQDRQELLGLLQTLLIQSAQLPGQDAQSALEELIAMSRELGGPAAEGDSWYVVGTFHHEGFRYRQALDAFERALSIERELENPAGEGRALAALGSVHADLGESAEALRFYEASLPLWRAAGDDAGEAAALSGVGTVYSDQGRLEEALELYALALALRRELGNLVEAAFTLNNMAEAYRLQGKYEEALEHFGQALALAREAGDRNLEGAVLNNLGSTYRRQGLFDEARRSYEAALEAMRETGDRAGEARALNNVGSLLTLQGRRNRALAVLEEALALRREIGDYKSEAITRANIETARQASADLALVEVDGTLQLQGQTDPCRMTDVPGSSLFEEAIGLSNRAVCDFLLPGRYDEALALFEEVLALRRDIGDRLGEGLMWAGIATVHLLKQEHERARAPVEEALAIFRETGSRKEEGLLQTALAALHLHAGELEASLRETKRAIDIQEELRSLQILDETKTRLADEHASAYRAAVALSVFLHQPEAAFDYAERARARTFLDQLGNTLPDVREANSGPARQLGDLSSRLTVLENARSAEYARGRERDQERLAALRVQIEELQASYTRTLESLKLQSPEYASLIAVSPLALREVQALLEADQTLLSYYLAGDVAFAFVVTAAGFEVVTLGASEAMLREAVNAFFGTFGSTRPEDAPFSQRALAELYDLLIRPLAEGGHLQTEYLMIAPHGLLHYLPFAALWDGATQTYLGERYALSYLPSASVLKFVREKGAENPNHQRLLALANPRAEGLPVLAHAAQEASEVAEFYGASALIGRDASKAALKRNLAGKDLILLAAHAELNQAHPLLSRILLAPEGEIDGALTVEEVYALGLSEANLVVLSACETGLGALSRGDDLVGLTRAFMYAGTPAVMASLWKVNDEATKVLITAFFANLRSGLSGAEALRKAQEAVRSIPEYAHPYYWAAFVLMGEVENSH